VSERIGIFYGLANTMSIFDVTSKIAYSRVEDVTHRVFAQEEVADDPHALCVLVVDP
jgi:hypothetical protein